MLNEESKGILEIH